MIEHRKNPVKIQRRRSRFAVVRRRRDCGRRVGGRAEPGARRPPPQEGPTPGTQPLADGCIAGRGAIHHEAGCRTGSMWAGVARSEPGRRPGWSTRSTTQTRWLSRRARTTRSPTPPTTSPSTSSRSPVRALARNGQFRGPELRDRRPAHGARVADLSVLGLARSRRPQFRWSVPGSGTATTTSRRASTPRSIPSGSSGSSGIRAARRRGASPATERPTSTRHICRHARRHLGNLREPTKGDRAASSSASRPRSRACPLAGTYEFVLKAGKKPSPKARLVYRVVDRGRAVRSDTVRKLPTGSRSPSSVLSRIEHRAAVLRRLAVR